MVSVNHPALTKRYWGYSSGTSTSARWAFFALFIVLLLLVVWATLRTNRNRLRRGNKPLAGTAWMTPPSYFQSQAQYNEPMNANNVPPYSANALPNDAGYYDANGNFISNPEYQPQKPPGESGAVVNDYTGEASSSPNYTRPSAPPPSHLRDDQNNVTGATDNTNSDVEYGYYTAGQNGTTSNNNVHEDDLELNQFTRPTGPPPTKSKN